MVLFTCILGIVLPLNPSATTVYARSAFYPNLRFTLSLQSAFYPWSAVCSLQSAVRWQDSLKDRGQESLKDRVRLSDVLRIKSLLSVCKAEAGVTIKFWHLPSGLQTGSKCSKNVIFIDTEISIKNYTSQQVRVSFLESPDNFSGPKPSACLNQNLNNKPCHFVLLSDRS